MLGFDSENFYPVLIQTGRVFSIFPVWPQKLYVKGAVAGKKKLRSPSQLNGREVGFVPVQLKNLLEILEKSCKEHIFQVTSNWDFITSESLP